LDQVTNVDIAAERRASLFVFPSTANAEPVLARPDGRQVDRMDDTTEVPETSELRATVLLFALVLLVPTVLGCALLTIR
jgi:hypothetical protein